MKKLLLLCALHLFPSASIADELVIATWNIANLHHIEGEKPRPWANPRDTIDYERLAEIARKINADIIALQEIGSPRAAAKIFDENRYHIIISDRYHQDSSDGPIEDSDKAVKGIYTAFAIDKQKFPKPVVQTISALSIQNVEIDREGMPANHVTRSGLAFNFSIKDQKIRLLNVHLKSSCAGHSTYPVYDAPKNEPNNPYASRFDCRTWLAQSMILENWIEQQDELGQLVIIGGDFNRRFNRVFGENNAPERSWSHLNDGAPNQLILLKGPESKNQTCWENHSEHNDEFIDFFVYDKELKNLVDDVNIANAGLLYENDERYKGKNHDLLSDHCPVVMRLKY